MPLCWKINFSTSSPNRPVAQSQIQLNSAERSSMYLHRSPHNKKSEKAETNPGSNKNRRLLCKLFSVLSAQNQRTLFC